MGLLDKALVLDKPEIRDERGSSLFSPDIDKIISSLSSISSGLDFPSTLFTRLKNEFHINKGALLLPEEDFHFVPWAETGFDRTTSSRIRIPRDIIEEIKRQKKCSILELFDSEMEVMSDFFSFREFSVTDYILLAPLFSEKQLVAILFITEGDILSKSKEEKQFLFRSLSDKAGPLLFSKRESILSKMEGFSHGDDTDEIAIDSFIKKHNSSSFILLTLQLNGLIDIILDKEKNSIPFRIKQDIMRLLKTLVSNKGEVINSDNNSVILLLNGSRIEEAELFVHQIGLSISYFYKITGNHFKPEYSVKKFPEDGNSAAELLQLQK